jgi:hypothetical protein
MPLGLLSPFTLVKVPIMKRGRVGLSDTETQLPRARDAPDRGGESAGRDRTSLVNPLTWAFQHINE